MNGFAGGADAIRIRPATARDWPGLARLRWEWAGHGAPGDEAAFAAHFIEWARGASASTHRCLVAASPDGIVGMAWLALTVRVPSPHRRHRRTGDLQSVYVTPSARGAGVGTRLVQAALDLADELGLERVVVHSSEPAVSLYRRLGFASSEILLDRPQAD